MIRIAQLTDLHLSARPGKRVHGVDTWRAFERALDSVAERDPDFVILTGDLAHAPSAAVYERMRVLLERFLPKLFVLPGNHDRPHLMHALLEDREPLCRDRLCFARSSGGIRLIGLDTSVRGRHHGRLGAEQLEWLARELDASSDSTLVFLHHPPIPVRTWWLDTIGLRDAAALGSVLGAHGKVRGLFCGHVHMDVRGKLAGVEVMTTPSTAYQFLPRSFFPVPRIGTGGFRMLSFDGSEIGTQVIAVSH